jgi:cytochrome c5
LLLLLAWAGVSCGAKKEAEAETLDTTTAEIATAVEPEPLPAETVALDGQGLLEKKCTVCHSLDRVHKKRADLAGWKSTVNRMIGKGAQLDAREAEAVAEYLTAEYGK